MNRALPQLPTERTSFVRVTDDWYVVCRSDELKQKPLSVTLFDQPLVVFRSKTGVACLLDRCPHRNVPLSEGKVKAGRIECPYHGWQFDRTGECRFIPCLDGTAEAKARRAPSFAAQERDGYIWVYAEADAEPTREPFVFPFLDDDRYVKVRSQIDMEGTIHAVAENALDVPHTAFLHGGLFRQSSRRHPIDVVIRRKGDHAEAEYIGEPAPTGLLGRVLAPGGGVVTHYDRFFLPSVTQVEYALGDDTHLVTTAVLTPLSERKTRVFGMSALRTPLRRAQKVLAKVIKPFALYVLKQDADILKMQSDAVQSFGGESLISTDADVLGPHIFRLLKNAEADKRSGEQPEKRIRMFV